MVKLFLYNVGDDYLSDDLKLDRVTVDLELTLKLWMQKLNVKATQYDELSRSLPDYQVLESFIMMLKSRNAQEAYRPTVTQVRQARQTVLEVIGRESPWSECAKAMLVYPGPRTILEDARNFCAVGVQDEKVLQIYRSSHLIFEEEFAFAFDDIHKWYFEDPKTVDALASLLERVQLHIDALEMVFQRASSPSLQEMEEDLVYEFSNVMSLLANFQFFHVDGVMRMMLLPKDLLGDNEQEESFSKTLTFEGGVSEAMVEIEKKTQVTY